MWCLLLKAGSPGPLAKVDKFPGPAMPMDGLLDDEGFLQLHKSARCSSPLLVFLGHETPHLQAFGEQVEYFRLLHLHLCFWCWLARLPTTGPQVCMAALALQSLVFCPAQLEGSVINWLVPAPVGMKAPWVCAVPGEELGCVGFGSMLLWRGLRD